MQENITVFQETLITALADAIPEYCQRWNYNCIEQLKENITEKNFVRIFCKITCTYYFKYINDTYGASFNKKEMTVKIYKCGKDYEKILAEYPIKYVIEKLLK